MDLLCWMALASRALATIASSIGIPRPEVRAAWPSCNWALGQPSCTVRAHAAQPRAAFCGNMCGRTGRKTHDKVLLRHAPSNVSDLSSGADVDPGEKRPLLKSKQ